MEKKSNHISHKVGKLATAALFITLTCSSTACTQQKEKPKPNLAEIAKKELMKKLDQAIQQKKEEQDDLFKIYKQRKLYKIHDTDLVNSYDKEDEIGYFHKEVNIQWPISLKGVQDIKPLQSHLIRLMFDASYPNIQTAITHFCPNRTMTTDEDNIGGEYAPGESITLELKNDINPNFVNFKLTQEIDLGGGTGLSLVIIVKEILFDKRLQKILSKKDIFTNYNSPQLLRLINAQLRSMMRAQQEEYNMQSTMPENFVVSNKDITFYCDEAPTYTAQGHFIEVAIPLSRLQPYLTNSFKMSLR